MITAFNDPTYAPGDSRQNWKKIAFDVGNLPGEVAFKILSLARKKHWQLISTSSFADHLPMDLGVCGALVGRLPSDGLVQDLVQAGIPVVRIGKWAHPEDSMVPAVIEDRSACGKMAAEHFVARGFKHVAYIGARPMQMDRILYEAFAGRAKELNCQSHLLQIDLDRHRLLVKNAKNHWEQRERFVTDWVKTLPLPVGMIFSGDGSADRYCHWMTRAKLRVPEDIAILGIGNKSLICEPALIPISSIALDHAGTAVKAIQVLDQMMAGKRIDPITIKIPPLGIVSRRSTDILAVSDPRVALALKLVWRHITEDLPIDWIAAQVGVSRRTLERAFKSELGRGISRELQRRRLETACTSLLHTTQPIGDIADALNFSSHQYFCHAFRKAYGMSPAQYRRRNR